MKINSMIKNYRKLIRENHYGYSKAISVSLFYWTQLNMKKLLILIILLLCNGCMSVTTSNTTYNTTYNTTDNITQIENHQIQKQIVWWDITKGIIINVISGLILLKYVNKNKETKIKCRNRKDNE